MFAPLVMKVMLRVQSCWAFVSAISAKAIGRVCGLERGAFLCLFEKPIVEKNRLAKTNASKSFPKILTHRPSHTI